MRGMVEGLETPHPIGLQLPALFQDDDFAQGFCAALDEVLAPVFTTLDSIEAYADPWLAPPDFLAWLSEWVAAEHDEAVDEAHQRELVARSAELLGWAGTARGLADVVELLAGVRPEIEESGATAWAVEPDGDIPGSDQPSVTVRVSVPGLAARGPAHDDRIERVTAVVHRFLPAHIPATIEVTGA